MILVTVIGVMLSLAALIAIWWDISSVDRGYTYRISDAGDDDGDAGDDADASPQDTGRAVITKGVRLLKTHRYDIDFAYVWVGGQIYTVRIRNNTAPYRFEVYDQHSTLLIASYDAFRHRYGAYLAAQRWLQHAEI